MAVLLQARQQRARAKSAAWSVSLPAALRRASERAQPEAAQPWAPRPALQARALPRLVRPAAGQLPEQESPALPREPKP
ncbi:MAG: hypothetical protein ABR587_07995, partial [Candidatus Binatia bacterium]